MQTKVTDRYAAIIKRKLSGLDCFLSSFSLLHRNAQSLLLRYLELLCRHFYRCTRDSFNTKQKLVPTSNFWFFISFATLSTSRLYPGPRGPSCDLSLLVGSCKPPHFTSAGGIHTNNLHVSINSCDFVRSPACAAASRAHAYGSCNSLNTSCGVISKPHFEVLGKGAFLFSRHKSASLPHTKGHWDQQPQWTLWLPCQSAFTSCASHNCIGSDKYLKTVLRLSPPGSKELWKRWRQCRRQRQEVLWGTAGRSAAPQGSRGQVSAMLTSVWLLVSRQGAASFISVNCQPDLPGRMVYIYSICSLQLHLHLSWMTQTSGETRRIGKWPIYEGTWGWWPTARQRRGTFPSRDMRLSPWVARMWCCTHTRRRKDVAGYLRGHPAIHFLQSARRRYASVAT